MGKESGDEKAVPKGIHEHGGGIRNMISSAIITPGLLQNVVGQFEKEGASPQWQIMASRMEGAQSLCGTVTPSQEQSSLPARD